MKESVLSTKFFPFSNFLPTSFGGKGYFWKKDSNCTLNKLRRWGQVGASPGQAQISRQKDAKQVNTECRCVCGYAKRQRRWKRPQPDHGVSEGRLPQQPVHSPSPASQLLRLLSAWSWYLESGCVRWEASHIEFRSRAEPAKEIVSIHLYPESSAVPQRLRRVPLPEGLQLGQGRKRLWGRGWVGLGARKLSATSSFLPQSSLYCASCGAL